jgi:hypothetical protein
MLSDGRSMPARLAIKSAGPVRRTDRETVLLFRTDGEWERMAPMSTSVIEHLDGFEFALAGLVVDAPAAPPTWPYWQLRMADQTITLRLFGLSAWRPGGHARADLTWSERDGVLDKSIALTAGIEALSRKKQDRAIQDAVRAWRALEHFVSRRGRPDLDHDAALAARIEMARKAAAIKRKQPTLGWDLIAPRVGASSGETLRRWIVEERLHER